ncbi:MAG TPA: hypothetical protein VF624_03350 [Tepidisphaeraceae bacterium]
MLILFALASLVLAMGRNARVESMAAANRTAMLEASAVELAAEQFVIGLLATGRESLATLDENDFNAVAVGSGYFWISRPDFGDRTLPRFGLVDESTKVSLNGTPLERLKKLPRITDEVAASIVDWRDEDDTATESGGESSYYLSRPEPHNAKNAAFESVDELRLLKGMTDELYAGPTNLVLGEATYGLQDAVTVWSTAKNTAADGSVRINVRDNNPQTSRTMRRQLAQRLGQRLSTTRAAAIMEALGQNRIQDLFDLALRGTMTLEEVEKIEDDITSSRGRTVGNRLNVNAAPRDLLLTLPNLTTADVDALMSRRPSAVAAKPTSIAWVYEVLKDRPDTLRGLGRRIIGRGDMYSADVVAASGNGRAFKHVKIVVDVSGTSPRIIYRQDVTDRGFPLDAQILTDLRAGNAPGGAGRGGAAGGSTIGAR